MMTTRRWMSIKLRESASIQILILSFRKKISELKRYMCAILPKPSTSADVDDSAKLGHYIVRKAAGIGGAPLKSIVKHRVLFSKPKSWNQMHFPSMLTRWTKTETQRFDWLQRCSPSANPTGKAGTFSTNAKLIMCRVSAMSSEWPESLLVAMKR